MKSYLDAEDKRRAERQIAGAFLAVEHRTGTAAERRTSQDVAYQAEEEALPEGVDLLKDSLLTSVNEIVYGCFKMGTIIHGGTFRLVVASSD